MEVLLAPRFRDGSIEQDIQELHRDEPLSNTELTMRFCVLWLWLGSLCAAQDMAGNADNLSQSIVCIKLPNGYERDPGGNILRTTAMAGSGCIVAVDNEAKCPDKGFETWVRAKVLTAAHVVDGRPPYNAVLRGGETTTMRVLTKGTIENDDIALCDCFVPPTYQPLAVAEDDLQQDSVEARGLAGLVPKWPTDARVVDGRRIGRNWQDGRAYYDLIVKPGDSGGPILADGKVVGVVSGGLYIIKPAGDALPHPIRNATGETWPLISVTLSRIREAISD